jgi:hypothetical protein
MLARVWERAVAAPDLPAAVRTLLTLDGHVPADIQLRALRLTDECALKVLFGVSWRTGEQHSPPADDADDADDADGVQKPAFLGEIGLTTGGRVVVRVPSQPALAADEQLVDAVIRVPWSSQTLTDYRAELSRASARNSRSVVGCRAWLAAMGVEERDILLEQLKEAARRTAPFVLYQEARRYTNFRERNNLTGKTLLPGHPDCTLSGLQGVPLELWSDSDAVMVVCLALLVRSAGFARIEEANGTQLTIDHIAELLERSRRAYDAVPGGRKIAPVASHQIEALCDLGDALRERRKEIGASVQLYREIHGPLMHKIERVAGGRDIAARRREEDLCVRLAGRLPVNGGTLDELGHDMSLSPEWLCRPYGGFGTGLESLVFETVAAARDAFAADFAMSRGIRSLTELVRALRREDWDRITEWELPEYFCCVVPAPEARRYFSDSLEYLADTAWAISARMQYNSWHFIPGNLPGVPEVVARDYFVPPMIPDIAYHSDQHHHGHVAARVRFSIRSPQAVTVLGRVFAGFVDLRLLRCEGVPFDEQDLLAAHRVSAFIAKATHLAAASVAAGEDVTITSFDSQWHWNTIAAGLNPGSDDED